jgi:hypothetical protein
MEGEAEVNKVNKVKRLARLRLRPPVESGLPGEVH